MRGTYVRKSWKANPALYAPVRYRRACSYDAFIPTGIAGLSLTLDSRVAALLSEAEALIAALNATRAPELAPLARLLLRTESIASSKVEGLQVSARSLARSEVKQDTGMQVGADAIEILASVDAMVLAVEETSTERDLATTDLLRIHAALMARSDRIKPGKFRTVQNWIGGNNYNPCEATFVPPPPENLAPLLDDLCIFTNDDALSPLVQAALAHAQFETIHPFEDGNGRCGRALVQVILRRRGLAPNFVPPISVMLARDKASYIDGLEWFRADRLNDWLRMFAEASSSAAHVAKRYVDLVTDLQQRWRDRLRAKGVRADAAVWPIIDALPAHPIITVSVGVTATGRTRPAVSGALAQLAEAGVLLPIAKAGRNRAWEAEGLLDLIEGLEAGEPR